MALQRVCVRFLVSTQQLTTFQLQFQGSRYPLLVSASTVCTWCTGLQAGTTYIHKIKVNKSLKIQKAVLTSLQNRTGPPVFFPKQSLTRNGAIVLAQLSKERLESLTWGRHHCLAWENLNIIPSMPCSTTTETAIMNDVSCWQG